MTRDVLRSAIVVGLLMPASFAWAGPQRHHRLAPPPESPPMPARPAPERSVLSGPLVVLSGPLPLAGPSQDSLFAAGPDTYVPHPLRLPLYPVYVDVNPLFNVGEVPPRWATTPTTSTPTTFTPTTFTPSAGWTFHSRRSLPTPPASAERRVPHAPDTFYVIPGCYAGNRPPTPERLPRGCDVARLRTEPIR